MHSTAKDWNDHLSPGDAGGGTGVAQRHFVTGFVSTTNGRFLREGHPGVRIDQLAGTD